MTGSKKLQLLIFYDYFYPAYKAGGPVQSLTNLVLSLQHEYDISVITSATDLNENNIPSDLVPDSWSEIMLPNAAGPVKVWYAGKGKLTIRQVIKLVRQISPIVVYLNGMFSPRFVLFPLITIKNTKIILCPRGMLQRGALSGKILKKRLYLFFLKYSGLVKKISWHATNKEEAEDIYREFGAGSKISVAGNIPKKPIKQIYLHSKRPGKLSMIYLSLISEKKNLLQLVNIVAGLKSNISLDIYGPVKDESYWKKCMQVISGNPERMRYMGDVKPQRVQDVFGQYHVSVLLTKGENFGHAIYESLSAGRPVITSNQTPWKQLKAQHAGWNVDISNENEITEAILHIYQMGQSPYNEFCTGAFGLANKYFENGFDITAYRKMFFENI